MFSMAILLNGQWMKIVTLLVDVNNMGGDNGFLKAIKLPDVSDMSDEEIQIHAKQIWQKLAKPKKESDDGNSKS